jgi:hypothetical protein
MVVDGEGSPVSGATMETTKKIVEAYCRHVKGWLTLPDIGCNGQLKIGLLAVDTSEAEIRRYHIEGVISTSGSFSKLNDKPYSPERYKERVQQAQQRRSVYYFIHRKFGESQDEVKDKLRQYGFVHNYQRIIVSWGATEEARTVARDHGILIWDFRTILKEIAEVSGNDPSYFSDDTMRTLQLLMKAFEPIQAE